MTKRKLADRQFDLLLLDKRSSLQWPILVLFYALFVQWSIFAKRARGDVTVQLYPESLNAS